MPRDKNLNGPLHDESSTISPELGIALLEKQIGAARLLASDERLIRESQFSSWENTTLTYIEQAFGKNHRNIEHFKKVQSFQSGYAWDEEGLSSHYRDLLNNLIDHLQGFITQLDTAIGIREWNGPSLSAVKNMSSNKVFIVHGHNHPLKLELAHALQNAGLDVTILHEQPNKGRTLIEKFAAHAQDAGFAVVLLTADDMGAAKPALGPLLTPMLKDRARQNVVFELGFFIGLLGRERVCALYEPGVEWPSDLNGIAYVEYDSVGRWISQVAKEINAAGINLDFSKLP
jgi:predicted nucleotide-binding protein